MPVGSSRVVEVLLYSGNDDLSDRHFAVVTYRRYAFAVTVQDGQPGCVTVDSYGRLDVHSPCRALLSVTVTDAQGRPVTDLQDSRRVCAVARPTLTANETAPAKTPLYRGAAVPPTRRTQKLVQRWTRQQAASDDGLQLPADVRLLSDGLANGTLCCCCQEAAPVLSPDGTVTWRLRPYADGSAHNYVLMVDSAAQHERDTVQHLIGARYLPDDGLRACALRADTDGVGVWLLGPAGGVTHVWLQPMSYADKALLLSSQTEQYVMRHGLASDARWDGQRWLPAISDNDGLWTAMYASGELYRYALAMRSGNDTAVQQARTSAMRSLKALLVLAHVSGRQGVVDSRLRYLTNTRRGAGNRASALVLRRGRPFAVDNYVGSPARQPLDYNGVDANTTAPIGRRLDGRLRFSLQPLQPDDWVNTTAEPLAAVASTARTLDGFLARSFLLPALEPLPGGGGVYFRRHSDSANQTVLRGRHVIYSDGVDDGSLQLALGNAALPDVLQSVLRVDGVQYSVGDVAYKGDTSTDEIVGHLFAWKSAYDVLREAVARDAGNGEAAALLALLRDTVRRFAEHVLANGYQLVDASGQSTKWGRQTRDYFCSDFTVDDAALNSLVLLATFKLAHYVTGEQRWQAEYRTLAVDHAAYRYADLAGQYLQRFLFIGAHDDQDVLRLDAAQPHSAAEQLRHAQYLINYSDEEMAMLAFYVLFSLEDDADVRARLHVALQQWWLSGVDRSENPLWYAIYQLSTSTDQPQVDGFGRSLPDVISWSLGRHPTDSRCHAAFVYGSRPDVAKDRQLSVDPARPIGRRAANSTDLDADDLAINRAIQPRFDPDAVYELRVLPPDERALRKYNGASFENPHDADPNNIEAATTYTLPFWFAVYHQIISFD